MKYQNMLPNVAFMFLILFITLIKYARISKFLSGYLLVIMKSILELSILYLIMIFFCFLMVYSMSMQFQADYRVSTFDSFVNHYLNFLSRLT